MTSTIKVNTIQDSCGSALVSKCGSTITLGASGKTVALATGASQTGFGRAGSVNWQTSSIKTSTFTAADGEGYFCNTSGGAFTVNLPAGSAGAIVAISDYTRTFTTNSITVAPNGSEKIGGIAASAKLTVDGQAATFVYVDSTEGWINVQNAEDTESGATFITATGGNTISTCGDYKIHTFTGPGTFTVCSVANIASRNEVSYIVVAGGGGGGGASTSAPTGYSGGGGGAGGFREQKSGVDNYTASPLNGAGSVTVSATGYPITIGAGGGGNPGNGTAGSNSTFSGITAAGGGFGSYGGDPVPAGGNGGSGGGSGGYGHYNDSPVTRSAGGTGNTPSVSPAQGSNGGKGTYTGVTAGGGGGGATAAGDCASYPSSTSTGGDGGAGAGTLINPAAGEAGPGPSQYYAGGGGGANGYHGTNAPADHGGSGDGGVGGGGDGGAAFLKTNSCASVPTQGDAGTANTGGGGGGSQSGPSSSPTARAGNAGGSGIVIIRYRYQ